tara:strand:+ start:1797 stop:3578 length:1782 start_codon:yes stop_codon:yes gene_type:complete
MTPTQEMIASIPWQYAADVKSGKIPAGEFIRLAVDRFYHWVDQAEADGYFIDHAAGMDMISFFPKLLNHTKGDKAGEPFRLAPFQQFTQYNVFAWKTLSTGLRRIRKVYDKRGKKNGKSAEMAGMSLGVMGLDNESAAEIYVAATKEDQAKICTDQAHAFIDHPIANPLLKAVGFITRLKEIRYLPNASKMRPLGGDSTTQDGINSHVSIIDEYHAHKDDTIKENLESSAIQRRQPLTYVITTAGFNVAGVCFQYEQVCKDMLRGTAPDNPTLWVMIHEMDEGDNWEDPDNWIKANPLLGDGLSMDRMLEEFNDSILQPSKQPNFKTKHLNIWVDAPDVFITSEVWQRNTDLVKVENFLKYGCEAAIDLSTTTDMTSLGFISYPDPDGFQDLLSFNFCPQETIDQRSRRDRVPYRYWSTLKYSQFLEIPPEMAPLFNHLLNDAVILQATPGNVVDYNIFEDVTIKYGKLLGVGIINYDRYGATQLVTNLQEAGLEMRQFAQTINYYSHPTKEFEKLVISGKLRHGNNPLLSWCLSGAGLYRDTNENIRLSKKHSTKRIDPLIAAVMALAGVINISEGDENQSAYNNTENEFYA